MHQSSNFLFCAMNSLYCATNPDEGYGTFKYFAVVSVSLYSVYFAN